MAQDNCDYHRHIFFGWPRPRSFLRDTTSKKAQLGIGNYEHAVVLPDDPCARKSRGLPLSLPHLQRGDIEQGTSGFICESIGLACVLNTIRPITSNGLGAPRDDNAVGECGR